jgi:PAS domain S-box-containing protein
VETGSGSLENYRTARITSELQRELLNVQDKMELFRILPEKVRSLIDGGLVIGTCLNDKTGELRVIHIAGIPGMWARMAQKIGTDPTKEEYSVSEMDPEIIAQYASGQLELLAGGLNKFSGGKIPKAVALIAEKALGIDRIYVIGLVSKGYQFGSLAILTHKDLSGLKEMIGQIAGQGAITLQRLTAEERLAESEGRYRSLLTAAPVLIGALVEDKVAFINPAGIKLLGAESADQIIGKNIDELVHPDSITEARARARRFVDGDSSVYPAEDVYIKLDGSTVTGEVIATTMTFEGKPAFHVIVQDITARKKVMAELTEAKDKALESDKLKSAFLANMSHEIRTPMNGILGFLDLLEDPDLPVWKQEQFREIVRKSSDRLLTTINNIIEISRIESGQVTMEYSDVDLEQMFGYLKDFFTPEMNQKGLEFRICSEFPEGLRKIRTDRFKLESIFINLIKNAIKFTDRGFIETGCRLSGGLPEFFVHDSGIGISIKDQESIFGRFNQAHADQPRRYEGSGLGLSISSAFVELLGGTFRLESEPGNGAVFSFTVTPAEG